jgi:hypothetical protein
MISSSHQMAIALPNRWTRVKAFKQLTLMPLHGIYLSMTLPNGKVGPHKGICQALAETFDWDNHLIGLPIGCGE